MTDEITNNFSFSVDFSTIKAALKSVSNQVKQQIPKEAQTNIEIDVGQFARDIKAGKSIGGKDGALGPLIKQLTQTALAAEIDSHLAQNLFKNRKNGYTT